MPLVRVLLSGAARSLGRSFCVFDRELTTAVNFESHRRVKRGQAYSRRDEKQQLPQGRGGIQLSASAC